MKAMNVDLESIMLCVSQTHEWKRLMPRSHQTFRPVSVMDLSGIMFGIRCWPTTFHTITTGDDDGWCQK